MNPLEGIYLFHSESARNFSKSVLLIICLFAVLPTTGMCFTVSVNNGAPYALDQQVNLYTIESLCNSGDTQTAPLSICNEEAQDCQQYNVSSLGGQPWTLSAGDGVKTVTVTVPCQHYNPATCYYQEQYACGSYCCGGYDWLGRCRSYCTSYCTRMVPYNCGYTTTYENSAADSILLDTTPPNPPLVDGQFVSSQMRATWTWQPGGGDGVRVFRFKLDDSDLTNGAITTGASDYSTILSAGNHTLYVQERDAAGNWSLPAQKTMRCVAALPPYEFPPHSVDYGPADWSINLSELLRSIQFYNSDGYSCDPEGEDGYTPGSVDYSCVPHDSDYNPQDWSLNLSELLRAIQFYNSGGYHPDAATEDGFAPGL